MSKVTMKDIADALNISLNAVSIALNNKVGVSDEMRIKILKVADEMGYIQKKKQYLDAYSKTNICVMMQSYYAKTGHFYSAVLYAVVEEAKRMGYNTIINYFDDNEFVTPECVEENKVSGIIVIGKIHDDNLTILERLQYPIVLCDYASTLKSCHSVLSNNRAGGSIMCQYLIDCGFSKIGFFGDLDYSLNFKERFIGYYNTLFQNKVVAKYNDELYFEKYSVVEDIEDAILSNDVDTVIKRIKTIKELPEVFMCANDSNAVLLVGALNKLGYKIPEDISVVGFDNTNMCEKIVPKLTTLNVDKEVMGIRTVQKLLELIDKRNVYPETILLGVNLVTRDSVKLIT
ncbi:MAG: LacI family DNA-binding transcriptional regulator [Coprobacillaceae bacterium]